MRLLLVILFTGTLAGLSFGQQSTIAEWTNITSKNGHFSISLPSDFLVFKHPDRNETTILSSLGDVSFKVLFDESQQQGFERLANLRQNSKLQAGTISKDFSLEKFEITTQTLEMKFYNLLIFCAERNATFSVSISAKSKMDKNLEAALQSIRLNQSPLFKQSQDGEQKIVAKFSVGALKTSQLIEEALRRNQKDDIELKMSETQANPSTNDIFYSRQFLVLRKEPPRYTEQARQRNVQGNVELEIVFKGDGTIGKISVIRGLKSGLNEETILVAKKIKFLPAEVDGKPVDVTKSVVYSFAIY